MLLNSENIENDCLGVEDTQDRISTEHVAQLRETVEESVDSKIIFK